MNAKKISLSVIAAALLGLASLSSHAAVIFSQDFEGALGASETVSGTFVRNTTGFGNNGTTMMGHAGTYANFNDSYYRINNLALTGSNILLSFDYAAQFETSFDGFNVKINNSVVTPTTGSDMQYKASVMTSSFSSPIAGQRFFDSSVNPRGVAEFDLSAFSGSTVDILFQFGADNSVTAAGFNMDNVLITNDQNGTIPEPASFALLGLGLAGLGLSRRKQA